MKNKFIAILLAFFLGGIGAHRWYLGQWGRAIFCVPFGIFFGPLTALRWFLTSRESFDKKYNTNAITKAILKEVRKDKVVHNVNHNINHDTTQIN